MDYREVIDSIDDMEQDTSKKYACTWHMCATKKLQGN